MADVAAELEAALTSGGTLLLWAEKYVHRIAGAPAALRTRLLAAGDQARRLARNGVLDASAADSLIRDVTAINRALRGLVEAVRTSDPYRAAVAARMRGDVAAEGALLPRIFAEVSPGPAPSLAYWMPTWQRRGRPLPAEDIVARLVELQSEGIPSSADDLTPGVDPELPGVLLSLTPASGAPIGLRIVGTQLVPPPLRLADDQLVVPTARLRVPISIWLSPPDEPLDEWIGDPAAYLTALRRACERAGFDVPT